MAKSPYFLKSAIIFLILFGVFAFINIKRGEADGARIAHTADFRRDAAGRRTLTPEGEGKGAMLMNSE